MYFSENLIEISDTGNIVPNYHKEIYYDENNCSTFYQL